MARVKAANANQLTTDVVTKLQESDTKRIEDSKKYQKDTDTVCEIVRKAKVRKVHPEYFDDGAFVELIAKVPQNVAIEAVKEFRFSDKYPCLTSFSLGVLVGCVLLSAITFLIHMVG